jgi:N-acetylmuramoyl-L-alanine amidase
MSASPQTSVPRSSRGELRTDPHARQDNSACHPRRSDALPSLLAFAQLRREERKNIKPSAAASRESMIDGSVLDEVLQHVAERALTMTGADGIAIALRSGEAIVCRASAGAVAPDVGAGITPDAGFSGECLISGSVVLCDDAENDARVDAAACRILGARSMLAVPLSAKRKVIGLIAAFSSEQFSFNDCDVRTLSLVAELILAAIRPEEDDRLVELATQPAAQTEPADKTPAVPPVAIAPIVAQEKQPLWPGTTVEIVKPAAAEATVVPAEAGITSDATGRVKAAVVPAIDTVHTVAKATTVDSAAIQPAMVGMTVAESAAGATRAVQPAPSTDSPAKWTGLALVAASVVIVLCLAGTAWLVHKGSQTKANAIGGQSPNPVAQTQAPGSLPEAETQELETTASDIETPVKPGETVSVTGVRHWSAADASTVVIDLGNHVQYEAHRLTGPERIYFDLHDTKLAAGFGGKATDVQDAFLDRIRVGQSAPGVTRVVLETKGTPDFSVSLEQNPYRLVVEIRKPGSKPQERSKVALFAPMAPIPTPVNPAPAVNAATASVKPATLPALPGILPRPIPQGPTTVAASPTLHIALDAGHGGWDLGTVGKTGLLEKDLVLDIVARLGKLVESRMGATVIYTRQNDDYVPLEKRAEVANLAHADLFLSVHANYSDSVSARGVETYYSNTFSSIKARDPRDDNAVLKNVNWTSIDIREKVHDSHRFAEDVQHALFGSLAARNPGLPNRGVKEAEYVVLTGTEMPAVLAEVSFVSSPTDEGNLKNPDYRQQIAESLYQGIASYEKDAGRVNVASGSKPALK